MKKHTKPKAKARKRFFDLKVGLFLLLLLLLPTQLGKHFFLPFSYLSGVRVDYLSPTLYLVDLVVVALFIAGFKSVMNFFRKRVFFFLAIILAFNVVLAKSPALAAYGSLRIFEWLVVFSTARQMATAIKSKYILLMFLTSGAVELALTVGQIILGHSMQGAFYFLGERLFSLGTPGIAKIAVNGAEYLRPYGTFSHPNSMAGFYLVVYFFVLLNRGFERHSILKYLSLFVFACLIFISFSKTAIMVFLVLNIATIFQNGKNLCRICAFSRLAVLTVLSLVFLIPLGDPMTIAKRIELTGNSLTIIKANPIAGTGLNNYLLAQSEFVSKYPLFFNQPVHNALLLFLSETGLIGALIIYWMVKFARDTFNYGQWVLLGAVFLTGMLDHYWLTLIQNFLLLGVIFGVTGFRDRALPEDSKSRFA